MRNAPAPGVYPVSVYLFDQGTLVGGDTIDLVVTPAGVGIDASPAAPRVYAEEIRASEASPVTLAATGAAISTRLDYRNNFV